VDKVSLPSTVSEALAMNLTLLNKRMNRARLAVLAAQIGRKLTPEEANCLGAINTYLSIATAHSAKPLEEMLKRHAEIEVQMKRIDALLKKTRKAKRK